MIYRISLNCYKSLKIFWYGFSLAYRIYFQEASQALGLYMEDDKELVRFQEDKDGFVLTLDTHMYRPSELHLTVKDGQVNISGR